MRKWIITTISIYLISVLVVVAGFFLLDIEHIKLNYWALGSLIFSFTVCMGSMITIIMKKRSEGNLFYSAGVNVLLIIYEIIVIVLVMLTGLFSENVNKFILAQIIVFSIYLILFVIFITFSKYINKNNQEIVEKIENGDFKGPKRGEF